MLKRSLGVIGVELIKVIFVAFSSGSIVRSSFFVFFLIVEKPKH